MGDREIGTKWEREETWQGTNWVRMAVCLMHMTVSEDSGVPFPALPLGKSQELPVPQFSHL